MLREEILAALRKDLASAREQEKIAREYFTQVNTDLPSGIPHPDGVQRIRNASVSYAAARTTVMHALSRLNGFLIHGTVPDEMQSR
ncbi:MAG: hypothetical protein ABJF23_28710 [Bryobacteraceae bacterium]